MEKYKISRAPSSRYLKKLNNVSRIRAVKTWIFSDELIQLLSKNNLLNTLYLTPCAMPAGLRILTALENPKNRRIQLASELERTEPQDSCHFLWFALTSWEKGLESGRHYFADSPSYCAWDILTLPVEKEYSSLRCRIGFPLDEILEDTSYTDTNLNYQFPKLQKQNK